MAFIRRNIWLAFYLFSAAWLLFFSYTIYDTYKSNYKEFAVEQRSVTTQAAQSYTALLRQYEVILNILANELFEANQLPDRSTAKSVLKNVADVDESIIGFAVFTPNGLIHTASNATLLPKSYNLLTIDNAKQGFLDALASEKVVFGQTYYSSAMRSVIMPAYFTIRDRYNDPVIVVNAAIDIEQAFHFFSQSSSGGTPIDSYLFRAQDRRFQYATFEGQDNISIYDTAIPEKVYTTALQAMRQQNRASIDNIMTSGKVYIHELHTPRTDALSASIYLNRYNLWLTSEVKLKHVQSVFTQRITPIVLTFIFSFVMIFWLFRGIARSELNKQKALTYQANHDYLTRLHNRYYLDSYMPELSPDTAYSLLFIDMDNFKTINDNYGHEVGDRVLCETAKRLLSQTSNDDIVARYSGDEFIVVSFNTSHTYLEQLSQSILALLNDPFLIKDYQFILSASIGIARYPRDGENNDEIIRYADLAMYESKKARNQVTFFEDSLKQAYLHTTQIELELKHALLGQEFYMVYQPQVTPDGHLHGVEALIRWENAQLGFVPPDQFISVAEAIGEMPAIGRFVLARSLQEMTELRKETGLKFTLSINISVTQFHHHRFFDELMTLTKKYQFDNLRLVLEVTENVFIEDVAGVQSLLRRIKSHGIRCSLDDFGTGYSSLNLLKRLPIDELKIDKSFVDDMLDDKAAYSMVEWIIIIAKKLGISTVAEGVETAEQRQALTQLGCDIFQGYHFSKPLNKHDLVQYMLKNNQSLRAKETLEHYNI